jgi:hypothetical protein
MMNSAAGPPQAPRRPRVRAALRRFAPGFLLLLLAGAWLVPIRSDDPALQMASSDRSHVTQFRQAIGTLPINALVLVACDADLGTYPEFRAATRAVLADLGAHAAMTAIVSYTPDGRAIAAAERDRIARAGGTPPADLGFVSGSEAGLVRGIASIVPDAATGATVDAIRQRGGGIGAFDLVVIISGSDFSARSWVEQVGARLPKLKLAAIAPTFLDPELEPYLRSGQLVALLATLREGVGYAQAIGGDAIGGPGATPAPLPMLVGMLVALGALTEAGMRRAGGRPGRRSVGRPSVGRAP